MLENLGKFLPNRTGQNQPNPEPNRNFGRFLSLKYSLNSKDKPIFNFVIPVNVELKKTWGLFGQFSVAGWHTGELFSNFNNTPCSFTISQTFEVHNAII